MDTGDSDGIGQINIQNFQSIIKNYEILIKELSSELNVFKTEQHNLTQKIHKLVNENNDLSHRLKEYDEKKQELLSETIFIENLKEQLELVSQEKDSVHGLWQKSLQTIHHLEEELKYFNTSQERVPKDEVNKMRTSYEQKINTLQEELRNTKSSLEQSLKSTDREIEHKNYELAKTMNTQTNTFKIVKNLEGEILKLQERLDDTASKRNIIEKDLSESNLRIDKLERENSVCRLKVTEALQIVEAALNEKDAALLRENEAKEEIEKLTKTLSEVISEAAEKVKNEVESIKCTYNNKLTVLISDMKSSQDEIKIKNLELDRYAKECKYLQEQLDKLKEFNTINRNEESVSNLIALEKTLESTFQKLLISEKQNVQLLSEKDNIKHDLDQMANYYERDIKTKNIERATMQNTITKLQDELQQLHIQIENMTKELSERQYQEQTYLNEKALKTYYVKLVEDIQKDNGNINRELQQYLTSQIDINKKWKIECRNITITFEKRLLQIKTDLMNLKKQNKNLKKKLMNSNTKIKDYKKFLYLITNDVKHVVDIAESDGVVKKH